VHVYWDEIRLLDGYWFVIEVGVTRKVVKLWVREVGGEVM
jgi:hypothetical protein